jgi:dGTPase
MAGGTASGSPDARSREPNGGEPNGGEPRGYDEAALTRWFAEPIKATPADRSPFARDRARVLHSSALRRLAAKTQVLGPLDDDFPRTRLTHSIETAQVGRELAAALGADPDLVEAACLAHDVGHPPFGHNGEAALDEAARMCGGFEGNAQSLRELIRLEVKVVDAVGRSAGLNLTRATLDATIKYPWPRRSGAAKFGVYPDDVERFAWARAGAPEGRRCIETQIMDWSDDVAYSVHDLEDGVVAGHIDLAGFDDAGRRDELAQFTAERGAPVTVERLREAIATLVNQTWWVRVPVNTVRGLAGLRMTTSELIARLTYAAAEQTRRRHGPGPLRRYAADLELPPSAVAECAVLKGITAMFVMERRAAGARLARQREVVAELVELVADRAPDSLDPLLRPAWLAACDDVARLRVVVDQVARLTDASATRRHAELTGGPVVQAL